MLHCQSTRLTLEQQAQYRNRGYVSPIQVLDQAEVSECRNAFLTYFEQNSSLLKVQLPRDRRSFFTETHLLLDWVYQIVSHPRALDAVEAVLGPDIMVWGSQWFPKFPGDKAYVSWHQDATYWGLAPPNVTTAWIAFSESTPENGCMRVVPGTHVSPLLPQRETYAPDNMLSRGQEIAVEVDESQAVDLVLQPGEMSLHHIGIVHGSGPNTSDRYRIGLAVRYIHPEVVQNGTERDLVLLVRGKDEYGHFEIVQPPETDGAPEERSVQAEALRRKAQNILPKSHQDGRRKSSEAD
jgi:non-heme Fe2+,alpha-ketoglutarate-dependent halogenase